MSSSLCARIIRFAILLAVVAALAIFAPTVAYADDCTYVGNQLSCSAVFTTSGQSMFGLGGQSEAVYHQTFGTSWSAGGSAGGIYNPTLFGASLGSYGAEVHASTSGNVGLTLDFRANGGTVNAKAPGSVTLTLPTSQTYHPGDLVTIGSTYNATSLSNSNFGFSTQSPTLAASAQFGFRLATNVGATVCVVKCGGFNLGFDTGQKTIPIFSYNEGLNGTGVNDISAFNGSGLALFGHTVNSGEFNGDLSKVVKGLYPGTWTVNANMSPSALSVATSSSMQGNLALASSVASSPMLSTSVDVANLMASALHLPPASGSLSDLLPDNASKTVKDIAGLVDYTLLKADIGAGLSLGQNFSMNAPTGAQITLKMQAGGVDLPSLTFQAGQTVQFRMPDAACNANGCSASNLTITPEITLDALGFSASTTLNPELMLSLQALGLSFAGLDMGPLVDWSKNIGLGSVSVFSNSFNLAGFNSIDAPSFTLGETLQTGTANVVESGGVRTVYYGPEQVTAGGLTLDKNSKLAAETLVGSAMSPATGAQRATITIGEGGQLNLDSGSSITSVDIVMKGEVDALSSPVRSLSGPNVMSNSTLVSTNRTAELQIQTAGSLTVKDHSEITLAGNVNVDGTLVVDNSKLTAAYLYDSRRGGEVGDVLINNGSQVKVEGVSFGTNGSMQITNGSSLETGNVDLESGYTVSVDQTSTVKAGYSWFGGNLVINGGHATLGSSMQFPHVTLNGGEIEFEGNQSQNEIMQNGYIQNNGGTITFDKNQNLLMVPVLGNGTLNVRSGADLELLYDYDTKQAMDLYFGQGSRLNIDGTLLNWMDHVHAEGATANVNGNLKMVQYSTMELGQLNIGQGGQFNLTDYSTATIGQVRNAGLLNVSGWSEKLTSASTIINTGKIVMGGGTIDAPSIRSMGGTLEVTATYYDPAVITGGYVQEDGSIVMKGDSIGVAQLKAASITLNGGTLTGMGGIQSNVTNAGGILRADPALEILGDYEQLAKGTLQFDFGTHFGVTGNASLNGLLLIDVPGYFTDPADQMYLPSIGTSWEILSVGGTLSGIFSQVQFDYEGGGDLPAGFGWELVYGSNGVDLVWSQGKDYGPLGIAIDEGSPLPTTFDNLPTTGLPPELISIVLQNNPGLTTDDLNHVNLGSSDYKAPTYNVGAVPEPGSLLLLGAGLAMAAECLRKFAR